MGFRLSALRCFTRDLISAVKNLTALMSFPASRTVNSRDVWWFICKRWWRGKCFVLQTRARIHLFSRVMSSKVRPVAQRPFSQHCLQRDLKQLHVRAQPRLSLWVFAAVFVNMGSVHIKSHWWGGKNCGRTAWRCRTGEAARSKPSCPRKYSTQAHKQVRSHLKAIQKQQKQSIHQTGSAFTGRRFQTTY